MTTPPPESDRRPGLRPPTFHLRTLFFGVAALCVFLAVLRLVGPSGAMLLTLLAICVVAHVAGNALGTQLRANGDTPLPTPEASRAARPPRRRRPQRHEFAPETRLRHRTALGRPTLVLTAMGVVAGAMLGGAWLAWLNWERATPANILLAVVSSAILGGLGGFLASSFFETIFQTWSQAARNVPRR